MILSRNYHKFSNCKFPSVFDGDNITSVKGFNIICKYFLRENKGFVVEASFITCKDEKQKRFIEILTELKKNYYVILSSDCDNSNNFLMYRNENYLTCVPHFLRKIL